MKKDDTKPEKKHPGGRPEKYTPDQKEQIYNALNTWINTQDDPTIVGFVSYDSLAIELQIDDDYILQRPEFSGLVKRAIRKQEAFLLNAKNPDAPVIRIFRLKQPQHGYKDRVETELSGSVGFSKVEITTQSEAKNESI